MSVSLYKPRHRLDVETYADVDYASRADCHPACHAAGMCPRHDAPIYADARTGAYSVGL